MAPRVLIAGSGPGALEAALALRKSEHLDAEVTLISPQTELHYRPNIVMEPFGVPETARYLVSDIIGGPGVQQWQGSIERIDADAGKAFSPEGDEFEFDAMIVATGAAPQPILPPPAISVGAPGSMDELAAVVAEIDAGSIRNVVFTVPDGPSYRLPLYELALMSADRADRQSGQQIAVVVVTPEAAPLDVFGPEHSETVSRFCSELGVTVRTGLTVGSFDGATMSLSDGSEYAVDRLAALPLLVPRAPEGLALDDAGFVKVDERQLVLGTANVYAVGDVTDFRVKQGGLASEEADTAVEAIEVALGTRDQAKSFGNEIQALLLTTSRRLALRAKIGHESSESLPAEQPTGPVQKIYSRLLAERLRELRPL